jgi:hypothetical protein
LAVSIVPAQISVLELAEEWAAVDGVAGKPGPKYPVNNQRKDEKSCQPEMEQGRMEPARLDEGLALVEEAGKSPGTISRLVWGWLTAGAGGLETVTHDGDGEQTRPTERRIAKRCGCRTDKTGLKSSWMRLQAS